jgi:hypothetical protein
MYDIYRKDKIKKLNMLPGRFPQVLLYFLLWKKQTCLFQSSIKNKYAIISNEALNKKTTQGTSPTENKRANII